MAIDAMQLLNQLASQGRISGFGPATGSSTTGVDQASFADLLSQARDGSLTSKLPVTIRSGAGVTLGDDQLARISIAADRAEASGLKNALVNIDGNQVVLDVHARQITGPASVENGIVGGIDGVIDLGNSGALGSAAVALGAQAVGLAKGAAAGLTQNASLARLLQSIQK